ncbi:FkbM family methyltransferase [Candidatus Pelagibacter sp. Uisw_092]|jgi:FkbM family methyltransferase|uniref:FkbM family methyltransferase n=1 Tax=Candidatus Pelagibacter sp. Uisw_092 TaxID=3230979 RepID=UPI0039EAE552
MYKKIIKKIIGLFGFKPIDKDLFKKNRILSEKSILNINTILKNLFSKKTINSLVQIGANDGLRFDTINYFIKHYKTDCLLVEPIKENYESLKENYKNFDFIKFENSAITVNNEINYLYKVNPNKVSNYGNHIPGITSFDKDHLIKHGVKKYDIIKESIESISIKDLLLKHNFTHLDLLFIDTEGYDGHIVIDFLSTTSSRPIIIFEYIHINNGIFKTLIDTIQEKNYIFFSINENMFCFPREKKKLIDIS